MPRGVATRGPGSSRRADDLWAAAGEHDLVVISTANSAHVPLGLAAIEAGLPVVMDKPLAPSAADGERLVVAARDRDVPFTVFQNRRWDSDFLTLRRLLGEGALGQPARFESRFERFRPQRDAEAWRERAAGRRTPVGCCSTSGAT